MPEIVDWDGGNVPDARSLAENALREGRLVALPTESVYEVAAAALDAAAVAHLQEIADSSDPLAMVLSGGAEAIDWLPQLGRPARSLLRKLGPGPWKLIAEGGADFGQLQCLHDTVRNAVCPDGRLALRWSEHPAWTWLSRRLGQPLVAAGFVPNATTAEQACQTLADRVGVVVSDRRTGSLACPAGVPPTHLRVTGKQWRIDRPGGLSAQAAEELMLRRVLFVCTGNTCRSPMAEALMTRLLADRLGCLPTELRQRGFLVQSAGLAAMMGGGAAGEAVSVVRQWGADLSMHRSRRLTLELLVLADHVFAMTESHRYALECVDVPELPTPQLLSPEGHDVSDPIGAEPEVYLACAQEILGHLQKRLPEIL